jgi:hypothetical protein
MVEGQTRKRECEDAVSNSGDIFQYVSGGNTDGVQSLRLQPRITPHIALRTVAHIMRNTVNLDHQIGIGAIEINPKFTTWMLAAELHTLWLASQ